MSDYNPYGMDIVSKYDRIKGALYRLCKEYVETEQRSQIPRENKSVRVFLDRMEKILEGDYDA